MQDLIYNKGINRYLFLMCQGVTGLPPGYGLRLKIRMIKKLDLKILTFRFNIRKTTAKSSKFDPKYYYDL